nr:DUF302 domain-containing protein [Gammaproteobacteria bacterium]
MYAFSVELEMPFSQALTAVTQALKEERLGIVSDIDVQAIMREKLNETRAGYHILGACAPTLAKRVLDADPEAGALLPCNVIVRELDADRTGVTFMDPIVVLGLAKDKTIEEVGHEARAQLTRVRDRLSGEQPVNRL